MLMLAVPMTVLFILSEIIARVVDRRRRLNLEGGPADDEASLLEDDPEEFGASSLDEEDD
jgi:sec-independent protein translocase protein TatC